MWEKYQYLSFIADNDNDGKTPYSLEFHNLSLTTGWQVIWHLKMKKWKKIDLRSCMLKSQGLIQYCIYKEKMTNLTNCLSSGRFSEYWMIKISSENNGFLFFSIGRVWFVWSWQLLLNAESKKWFYFCCFVGED